MEGSATNPPEGSATLPATEAELVAEVEKALYQLYSDPDPERKSSADRWLQALQRSPQAWNLPWTLLQHQTLEVKNYGVLMLLNKINESWGDLSDDQHGVLRHQLFKSLAQYSSGPNLMLIQLSKALVGVAFQTLPDRWPNTVISSIHSLKKACETVEGSNFTAAVIQLMTIFPEEFEVMCGDCVTLKRRAVKTELAAGLQSVLSVMEDIIAASSCNNATKNKAINCCISWLIIGISLAEMTNLLSHLFDCLLEPELLQKSAELLSELVNHDDAYKYPTTLRKFLRRVLGMKNMIRKKLENHDEDACMSLVKVVAGAAHSNLTFLTTLSEDSPKQDLADALDIVQLVNEFLCVPGTFPVDERCSEATFPFWTSLMDQLGNMEPDQCRFHSEFFSAHISTLIEALPDKVSFPSDEEYMGVWVDEERDEFVKYREDICDIGEVIQFTMHVEYLQRLSSMLTGLLSASQPPTWQSIEAILYLLQGVAGNVTQQSSAMLQNVLRLFPHLPRHITLMKAALGLLGMLSSWFKQHPSLLQGVLPMILEGLTEPELAPCSALSFKDICIECSNQLSNVAEQLIPHCQQAFSNQHLTSRDCVCLVTAIGTVLSTLPVSEMMRPLEALVSSRVDHLRLLAQYPPSAMCKVLLERELDVMGALCHHVYPELNTGEQHPVVLLMIQLFPALQMLISKWCGDHDVVEGICVVINRAMRTVNEQYIPLLEETVELIVKCYAVVQHHKLLDSASQIIEIFGREASCSSLLTALLQPLHSLTVQLFQTCLRDDPDLVDAYLGLAKTTVTTNPGLVLGCEGVMENYYEIGFVALKLPEQGTVIAASSFFVSFINLSESAPSVAEIVRMKGYPLVQYLLQAIAGAANRSYLSYYSDVLYCLLCNCITSLAEWLEDLLSKDGFPSDQLTLEEKQQFRATLLRGQQNKRVMKDKVKEFSIHCRGFHGTMYGAETV